MATKAAKSLTINATKFELANTLDVANGKLQLKAKDVVLSEVDYSNEFVIELADNQNLSTAGSKVCTAFTKQALLDAVDAGKTIKVVAKNVVDQNDNYNDTVVFIPSTVRRDVPGEQVYLYGFNKSSNTVGYFLIGILNNTITSINLY